MNQRKWKKKNILERKKKFCLNDGKKCKSRWSDDIKEMKKWERWRKLGNSETRYGELFA